MAIEDDVLLARIRRIEDWLMQAGQKIGVPFEIPGEAMVPPEVLDMVRNGDRLQEVKRLADDGMPLGEAKRLVDSM
ncbi:MAG TPA: hypothetical protein VF587_10885 [Solirubrobacteraceae bacterium]|jgi:hypothetical protein